MKVHERIVIISCDWEYPAIIRVTHTDLEIVHAIIHEMKENWEHGPCSLNTVKSEEELYKYLMENFLQ